MSEDTKATNSIDKIAKALIKAQREFSPITKTKTANAGKFSYKYADLADVIEAVMPALNANGIAVSQDISNQELITYLIHESGQALMNRTPLILGAQVTPQSLGSAITYARRYSLCSVLNVVAEEDDDAHIAEKSHHKHQAQPHVTQQQQPESDAGSFLITFGKYNNQKVKDIPALELKNYIDWIIKDNKKKNKELFSFMKDFVEAAEMYLESLKSNSQSIRYDQDQLISFEQTELLQ